MRRVAWLVVVALSACNAPPPPPATPEAIAAVPRGDPVEGERIATIVGCNGCHEHDGRGGGMDMQLTGGDRIVAPNLTRRRALYDAAALAALLREGRTHDGHPPLGMPIFAFQLLSDREVRDIAAWLEALPAVDNPGLAESVLSATTARQLADGTFPFDDHVPDPGNRPPAARPTDRLALGRHLALTACSECHGRDLDGWGPDDPAPGLIVAKAYTDAAFARLMKTGIAANGKETATGRMSQVARRRFSSLTDEEIAALKAFLDAR